MDKEDFDLEIEEDPVYEEDDASLYEDDDDEYGDDEDEDEDIDADADVDGDVDADVDIGTHIEDEETVGSGDEDGDEDGNGDGDGDGDSDNKRLQKNNISFVKNLSKNNIKSKNIKFTNPSLVRKKTIIEKSNKPKILYIVPASERITSDLLIKSERAQLEGILSKHIDKNGCPEYLNDIVAELKKKNLHVLSDDIAGEIIKQRRCPLLLRRVIGENNRDELVVEEWDPNIMKIHL